MKCTCGKVKNPIFNYKGLKAAFCNSCKTPDMVDVRNRMCHECGLRANFKDFKLYYCNDHKPSGAFNIHTKLCSKCKNIQPYFNYRGCYEGKYCFSCKTPEMINVKAQHCIVENCEKVSLYNYKNESKPLYCIEHKLENMVNTRNNTCIEENCLKSAVFGVDKIIHCLAHKEENEINLQSYSRKRKLSDISICT